MVRSSRKVKKRKKRQEVNSEVKGHRQECELVRREQAGVTVTRSRDAY